MPHKRHELCITGHLIERLTLLYLILDDLTHTGKVRYTKRSTEAHSP